MATISKRSANRIVDTFPYKVELHVHLDGAVRLTTLLDIARQRKIQLASTDLDDLRASVCVYDAMSLYLVLDSFKLFMPIISGCRDTLKRIAFEFCEDCARNNIRYAEAPFSPHLFANNESKPEYALTHGDLTPREVVRIVTETFKQGSRDFQMRAKCILCCMRHRPDWSEEVVQLAYEYRNDGVVAIDIAGGSNLIDGDVEHITPQHKEAFKKAHSLGIHITVHAGEAGGADRVKQALDELFAERIGHGYRCLEDEHVYREIIRRQVHLETCPISSVCTGSASRDVRKHPVVRFAKDGVNFSINTDDPLVFDSVLLDDYTFAMEMGLTRDQIVQTIFNAAKSCFASTSEKNEILEELSTVYDDKRDLHEKKREQM